MSGGNGNCLAELKVQEEHLNRGSTFHGGLSATLIDCVTTIALVSKESPPGVSVNLNVKYVNLIVDLINISHTQAHNIVI